MRADAFFERSRFDRVRWSNSPSQTERTKANEVSRIVRTEEGLAVRLLGKDRSWFESRDSLNGSTFDEALRRTARSLSSVPMPHLAIDIDPWPDVGGALAALPKRIEAAVRDRRAAFPFSLELTHHERAIALAGPSILAEPQTENYVSFRATLHEPDSVVATAGGLLALEAESITTADSNRLSGVISDVLVERFRARKATAPQPGRATVVLGPNAAAILLHEAVSHALEVDVLSMSGRPRDAIGVQLGSELLDVLEDPSGAPASVSRSNDDEGTPTQRRWLLRQGRVTQPIADVAWSERFTTTDPGCGRRASRHDAVGPRSHFLELLCGTTSSSDLLDGDGLWVDQIQRGSLMPQTGLVTLLVACGRRFAGGRLKDRVGPFTVRGHLADLLCAVTAVGNTATNCGAGWCAKDGQRLPVWAKAPSLRLDQVEVLS